MFVHLLGVNVLAIVIPHRACKRGAEFVWLCVWGLSPLPILAELDTQLIIAEMQGYAPYAHEMKSRIIGLMAAIRKFAAALRK